MIQNEYQEKWVYHASTMEEDPKGLRKVNQEKKRVLKMTVRTFSEWNNKYTGDVWAVNCRMMSTISEWRIQVHEYCSQYITLRALAKLIEYLTIYQSITWRQFIDRKLYTDNVSIDRYYIRDFWHVLQLIECLSPLMWTVYKKITIQQCQCISTGTMS